MWTTLALIKRIDDSVLRAGRSAFGDQSLLTFHQLRNNATTASRRSLPVDPSLVDLVIAVDRNAESGQLYSLIDLDNSYHGTIPKSDFKSFISPAYPPLRSSSNNESTSRKVRHLHISNDRNFVSREDRVVVINNGMQWSKAVSYTHLTLPTICSV